MWLMKEIRNHEGVLVSFEKHKEVPAGMTTQEAFTWAKHQGFNAPVFSK